MNGWKSALRIISVCCSISLSLSMAEQAFAKPAQIVLLRHAEKPDSGNSLSRRGWERARALPRLFQERPEFKKFGPPAVLFGMAPATKGQSIRALQTLKYVGETYQLPINHDYNEDEIDALVSDIDAAKDLDGKVVVICWHRNNMPELARALGVRDFDDIPKDQYDRVWLIEPQADGTPTLQDLPQRLLSGDSAD